MIDARKHRFRLIGWGGAGMLLLLPLAAMQVTDEVNWDETDFLFAGVLFGLVGTGIELAVRFTRNRAYRAGAALALVTTLLLIWVNAAVGYIGSEDNPANLLFAGVLGIGWVGGAVARFRAAGLARALLATALAHAVVGAYGVTVQPVTLRPTIVFVALWLAAAWLFARAGGVAPGGLARGANRA